MRFNVKLETPVLVLPVDHISFSKHIPVATQEKDKLEAFQVPFEANSFRYTVPRPILRMCYNIIEHVEEVLITLIDTSYTARGV